MSKRILVTGSRDWNNVETICAALESALQLLGGEDVVLVTGACPTGADLIATAYWTMHDLGEIEEHPADWDTHGKKAGWIRNKEMADAGADICLAFIRNNSRGSEMMVDLAEDAGIQTMTWRMNDVLADDLSDPDGS
jgi:hypothetical protein